MSNYNQSQNTKIISTYHNHQKILKLLPSFQSCKIKGNNLFPRGKTMRKMSCFRLAEINLIKTINYLIIIN